MFSQKFYRLKNPTPWRRISLATWSRPDDPTVYGSLEIDFTASKIFLEKINRGSSEKITITHLVAKAIALTLKTYPDLNGIIRWGRIYLRRTVDLFFQVSIDNQPQSGVEGGKSKSFWRKQLRSTKVTPSNNPFRVVCPIRLRRLEGATRAPRDDKPDLSGVVVEACEEKSLREIARTLGEKSGKVRSEGKSDFSRTFDILKYIPFFLRPWMIRAASFLIYNLGWSAPRLGLPQDPFGSAMITSVGMFKMPPGFAPLVPVSRVPLVVCIGEVKDKPWVDNGQVVVRPILELSITFDHRFMDGLTGSRMAHYFQEIIEQPENYLSSSPPFSVEATFSKGNR